MKITVNQKTRGHCLSMICTQMWPNNYCTQYSNHSDTSVLYKCAETEETGWCRGYGFVTFEQRHEAENALLALNFLEILGRPIHITWAQYITVTILARHGDRFAICDALSDFVGLQPYREVCDENDEPKDQEPTESRENSYDEPRPLLVSNSSNDWQEIARTESTEQSWGRRLANTIKSYFIKVMSSPKTLLGIGLLALACTDSFIRSL